MQQQQQQQQRARYNLWDKDLILLYQRPAVLLFRERQSLEPGTVPHSDGLGDNKSCVVSHMRRRPAGIQHARLL